MRERFPLPALLVLCLALTSCAGGTNNPAANDQTNGSPSVTATGTRGATGSGSTGGSGGSPSGGSSGGGGTPADEYAGPDAGTYHYTTSIDLGPEGQRDGRREIRYYPRRDADVVVHQITQITGSDERHWWFRFSWRSDGLSRVTDLNPSGGLCTFDRPLLELKLPVRNGQRFASEAICREQDTVWRLEVNIDGTERIAVDGRQVDAFVVERKLWRAPRGEQGEPLLETYWFDPATRLYVRMRTQAAGSPLDLVDRLNSREPEPSPRATPPSGV